jgi:acyl-coenzyme A synthetase/AMP-(fatty) acid ligase
MLAALLNGAAVYPFNVKEEGLACMAPWLGEQEITIYSSVSTLFRNFAATIPEREQFPELRLVYLGGEPVRKTDVELYKARFARNCLFVGRLGISETGTIRYYFIDVHRGTKRPPRSWRFPLPAESWAQRAACPAAAAPCRVPEAPGGQSYRLGCVAEFPLL